MINILGICDNAEILSVLRLVRIVIKAMQIAVPIILIVTLSINFSQAVASHDANALSKAKTKAVFQGNGNTAFVINENFRLGENSPSFRRRRIIIRASRDYHFAARRIYFLPKH